MRRPDIAARDQLGVLLARHGPVSAPALVAELGVSTATLHRMLVEMSGRLVVGGRARRRRYALQRQVRGETGELPLYRVDIDGRAEQLSRLAPMAPQGSWMPLAGTDWPVVDEAVDGWWGGLPYPLYDMRPQGYMGRQFARAEHRQLGVGLDPNAWSDDDILHVLRLRGADFSGNLILGDPAYERWLVTRVATPAPLSAAEWGAAYAAMAADAIAAGVAGSSAAGEFPKFAALRELPGSSTPHVLVKFSGADGSPAVQRWADLLVCEHLSLTRIAGVAGLQAAASRIVQHAGRTFLEVERFDRHGDFGRSALCSLASINAALIGEASTDWTRLASRLADAGLLQAQDTARIELLWWFGRLIANTDMHTGNLSFRPTAGQLALAPAYDMLPMLYAPLPGGEVPAREFEPPLPLPQQRPVWLAACTEALGVWQAAAADSRISAGFRALCRRNAERLLLLADRV
jgi:hypothetical protein